MIRLNAEMTITNLRAVGGGDYTGGDSSEMRMTTMLTTRDDNICGVDCDEDEDARNHPYSMTRNHLPNTAIPQFRMQ